MGTYIAPVSRLWPIDCEQPDLPLQAISSWVQLYPSTSIDPNSATRGRVSVLDEEYAVVTSDMQLTGALGGDYDYELLAWVIHRDPTTGALTQGAPFKVEANGQFFFGVNQGNNIAIDSTHVLCVYAGQASTDPPLSTRRRWRLLKRTGMSLSVVDSHDVLYPDSGGAGLLNSHTSLVAEGRGVTTFGDGTDLYITTVVGDSISVVGVPVSPEITDLPNDSVSCTMRSDGTFLYVYDSFSDDEIYALAGQIIGPSSVIWGPQVTMPWELNSNLLFDHTVACKAAEGSAVWATAYQQSVAQGAHKFEPFGCTYVNDNFDMQVRLDRIDVDESLNLTVYAPVILNAKTSSGDVRPLSICPHQDSGKVIVNYDQLNRWFPNNEFKYYESANFAVVQLNPSAPGGLTVSRNRHVGTNILPGQLFWGVSMDAWPGTDEVIFAHAYDGYMFDPVTGDEPTNPVDPDDPNELWGDTRRVNLHSFVINSYGGGVWVGIRFGGGGLRLDPDFLGHIYNPEWTTSPVSQGWTWDAWPTNPGNGSLNGNNVDTTYVNNPQRLIHSVNNGTTGAEGWRGFFAETVADYSWGEMQMRFPPTGGHGDRIDHSERVVPVVSKGGLINNPVAGIVSTGFAVVDGPLIAAFDAVNEIHTYRMNRPTDSTWEFLVDGVVVATDADLTALSISPVVASTATGPLQIVRATAPSTFTSLTAWFYGWRFQFDD